MKHAHRHEAWNNDKNNSYLHHFENDSARELLKYWLFQDESWIPFDFRSIVLFLLYSFPTSGTALKFHSFSFYLKENIALF